MLPANQTPGTADRNQVQFWKQLINIDFDMEISWLSNLKGRYDCLEEVFSGWCQTKQILQETQKLYE